MSYPEVISLIDEELRRLVAARDFLLAPHAGSENDDLPEFADALADLSVSTNGDAGAAAQLAPPVVKRLKPRERRATRTRREAPSVVTALSGAAPLQPVYVAATQVRSEQAVKDTAGKEGAPGKPAEILTPELLHQRWISNSAGR